MITTIIFWLLFAYLVGKYAEKKGHNFATYMVISLLLSPLVGFIIALVSGDNKPKETIAKPTQQQFVSYQQLTNNHIDQQSEGSFCPHCGSKVLSHFSNCPNCGASLK